MTSQLVADQATVTHPVTPLMEQVLREQGIPDDGIDLQQVDVEIATMHWEQYLAHLGTTGKTPTPGLELVRNMDTLGGPLFFAWLTFRLAEDDCIRRPERRDQIDLADLMAAAENVDHFLEGVRLSAVLNHAWCPVGVQDRVYELAQLHFTLWTAACKALGLDEVMIHTPVSSPGTAHEMLRRVFAGETVEIDPTSETGSIVAANCGQQWSSPWWERHLTNTGAL